MGGRRGAYVERSEGWVQGWVRLTWIAYGAA